MAGARPALSVRIERPVHPGLALDVALDLEAECGVVFGPSGGGKTSLLRAVAGLDRPARGHVRLGDLTLFDSDARLDRPLHARRIGMIFQDDRLFPHLDAAGNIRFGLKGWPRAEAAARLAEVADLCGVIHLLGRPVATLSGGERQRVGLARALAPRPRLLLCDEPVSALDLAGRHALLERLRLARAAEAIPMLYVTHSPAEAVALGDRLFLLDAGRVVASGAPLDVLAAAAAGRAGRLEGLRNVVRGRVEGPAPAESATLVRLAGGPTLVVPRLDLPAGALVTLAVRADDILIASGPIAGLSARNALAGVVERLVPHGAEAEVVVRTGSVPWIASLVAPAVAALGLAPGAAVHVIIKARSMHVVEVASP